MSLLCKWWWKLENENGIWQEIVRMKYLEGKCLTQITHKTSNSPVWNDLIKIKHIYIYWEIHEAGKWKIY